MTLFGYELLYQTVEPEDIILMGESFDEIVKDEIENGLNRFSLYGIRLESLKTSNNNKNR